MAKYKIVYDRTNCIGASSCAAISPNNFRMVEDGKADLLGGEKKDGRIEKIVEEDVMVLEAAKSCPEGVIKIFNLDTGEELV